MNSDQQPVIIPQKTIGRTIKVNTNGEGYVITSGLTAVLIFRQVSGTGVRNEKQLTCAIAADGLSVSYTTVGGEFDAIPGLCDAQVKVFASGVLDYSYVMPRLVNIQPPLG